MLFLSCRTFVVITTFSTRLVGVEVTSVENVITTKGLQDRNIHILDGTMVENKGKLILPYTLSCRSHLYLPLHFTSPSVSFFLMSSSIFFPPFLYTFSPSFRNILFYPSVVVPTLLIPYHFFLTSFLFLSPYSSLFFLSPTLFLYHLLSQYLFFM